MCVFSEPLVHGAMRPARRGRAESGGPVNSGVAPRRSVARPACEGALGARSVARRLRTVDDGGGG